VKLLVLELKVITPAETVPLKILRVALQCVIKQDLIAGVNATRWLFAGVYPIW